MKQTSANKLDTVTEWMTVDLPERASSEAKAQSAMVRAAARAACVKEKERAAKRLEGKR